MPTVYKNNKENQNFTQAKRDVDADNIQVCFANVLWVAFSIPSGSLLYRVIHERGISEFLFTATHYTHCNNILISNF
jgi:hypothetical protein